MCALCKLLSGAPATPQWKRGTHALELNDTTDVGLAIATFYKGKFGPDDSHNSGIYMGHDPKTGGIMIVDQWPDNGPSHDHANQHTLSDVGSNISMSGAAYYVIITR